MEDGMRLRRAAVVGAMVLWSAAAAFAQGGESFKPTETVAPDIPGVVAAGARVQVVAAGLRGTEGPIAAPDGALLLTEQTANVITRIDADGRRSTFLDNTNGCQGLTFDRKGRLIGVLPTTKQIAVLTPARAVIASAFDGQPFAGPNDLVADSKGGVYFTDPGGYPPPGQYLTHVPGVYYIRPNGAVIRIADDIARPNGIILSPDEKTLYVANTLGAFAIAFDVQADGSVRNQRNFARLDGILMTNRGVRSGADGIAVDDAGRLYVTTTIGVQVFSPQGRHLGTIPIGNPDGPQNLAFAGPDRKTLYVVGDGAVWKVAMLAQGPRQRAK
jgi:gluconolactonase